MCLELIAHLVTGNALQGSLPGSLAAAPSLILLHLGSNNLSGAHFSVPYASVAHRSSKLAQGYQAFVAGNTIILKMTLAANSWLECMSVSGTIPPALFSSNTFATLQMVRLTW